ncbi:GNAT family N-acetyltransferase [Ruminococcus sp. FC2018]|uniref:GNAT family N-acetyltransferase n=1 Tax=Ruminococcus sp. FC2018 TaxID=1410617 RepID=UPI0009DEEA9B|nr:GNAT family N-acetyltransferase [Ruminococcus sp. FC2018]
MIDVETFGDDFVELIRIELCDAPTLWQMQTEAFRDLLEKYQDFETDPACESVEKVQARLQDGSFYYFIVSGGEKIGALRVVAQGTKKLLSPIFIMKHHRSKGYAQAAVRLAEQIHGEHSWELSTILQEQGNCHLYEKLGYKRTGRTEKINDKMDLVFYEKD